MGESETVMDGRRVEGRESPDGTVKRIHNGNTTLAVFSVPVPPRCSDGSDGECSLTWVQEKMKHFLIMPQSMFYS